MFDFTTLFIEKTEKIQPSQPSQSTPPAFTSQIDNIAQSQIDTSVKSEQGLSKGVLQGVLQGEVSQSEGKTETKYDNYPGEMVPVNTQSIDLKDLFINVRTENRPKIQAMSLEQVSEYLEKLNRGMIELKALSVEAFNHKRNLDEKSGKSRWDKASGPKLSQHLANPEGFGALVQETKRVKKALTSCEKAIAGMVSLGESDQDIIEMFNSKFKLADIKDAIAKAKVSE